MFILSLLLLEVRVVDVVIVDFMYFKILRVAEGLPHVSTDLSKHQLMSEWKGFQNKN